MRIDPASPATTTTAMAAPAAGATTAAGTGLAIFVLGRATSSVQEHGIVLVAACGAAVLALWFALRGNRAVRAWSIGGIVATVMVAMALGGLLSRPTEANEQVVTADVDARELAPSAAPKRSPAAEPKTARAQNALLASGSFQPLAHAGTGTASLIRTADRRNVLTLTDFETDAGPDLFVWLVAGNPASDTDVEQRRSVSLGKLKGNSGDQQYVLPPDVDPSDFTHVYVWCRAFSVGFTSARLA